MSDKMLTVKEVSERLNVSERQVRVLVDQKELTIVRIGLRGYRIPESSLQAYIERNTERGKQE